MMLRKTWANLAMLSLVNWFGCGSEDLSPSTMLDPVQIRSRIVDGEPALDPNYDAVVLLSNKKYSSLCTGVILSQVGEPVVVLTARHCVSRVRSNFNCSPSDILFDYDVTSTEVRKGPSAQTLVGMGLRAFTPPEDENGICNNDFAVLMVEATNQDVQPFRLRTDTSRLSKGEEFAAIGYGARQYPDYHGATVGERYIREDVKVTHVGPVFPSLYSREFAGTEALCDGDSGGPAVTSSQTVMGIASRMSGCTGGVGLWVRVEHFLDVIDRAFHEACATFVDEDGEIHPSETNPDCFEDEPELETDPDAGDSGVHELEKDAEGYPDVDPLPDPEISVEVAPSNGGGCRVSYQRTGSKCVWLIVVGLGILVSARKQRVIAAFRNRSAKNTHPFIRTP